MFRQQVLDTGLESENRGNGKRNLPVDERSRKFNPETGTKRGRVNANWKL